MTLVNVFVYHKRQTDNKLAFTPIGRADTPEEAMKMARVILGDECNMCGSFIDHDEPAYIMFEASKPLTDKMNDPATFGDTVQ